MGIIKHGRRISTAGVILCLYWATGAVMILPICAAMFTSDHEAVNGALATNPFFSRMPPDPLFFVVLPLGPAMIVAIVAAIPVAIVLAAAGQPISLIGAKFLLALAYLLEGFVWFCTRWPETVKDVRIHLIAMFSGGFKVPDEQDVERVRQNDADRKRDTERITLEHQRDSVVAQAERLRNQLPNLPALPQDPLRYRTYLTEIQDQVQTYIRTRTLEQYTERFKQYNALIAEALKLEEQIDAMRNIGETREIRQWERELHKVKVQDQIEEVADTRERRKLENEKLRREIAQASNQKTADGSIDLLEAATSLADLEASWNLVQIRFAEQMKNSKFASSLKAIYENQRLRIMGKRFSD